MIRGLARISSLFKRRPTLKTQGGFTIFHALVGGLIAGVGMTGTWIAYANYSMQARVMNADRQMDQYAASAMQEMTNLLTWSWGANPIRGGSTPLWQFQIFDSIAENGAYNSHGGGYVVSHQFLDLTYRAAGGIVFSNQYPQWAVGRTASYFIWRGQPNLQHDRQYAFDRRDGMSVTGMTIDYPAQPGPYWMMKRGFYEIEIRMQYRYTAPYGISLFSNQYVHERLYHTKIFPRNWDVEQNDWRRHLQLIENQTGGGTGGGGGLLDGFETSKTTTTLQDDDIHL
jgi:hypothetical protein